MLLSPIPESEVNRAQDQGHLNHSEKHVADEDREIDHSDCTHTFEGYRADVEVIDHVADQEQGRNSRRTQHQHLVETLFAPLDRQKPRNDKRSCDGVQHRVDVGEDSIVESADLRCDLQSGDR